MLRIDAEVLRQIAEPAPQLARIGEDVEAVEDDRPRVRLLQRGDGAHQRRLAGAVRPEQPEQPLADLEAHVIERADAVGIGFRKMRDGEQSGPRWPSTRSRGYGFHRWEAGLHRFTPRICEKRNPGLHAHREPRRRHAAHAFLEDLCLPRQQGGTLQWCIRPCPPGNDPNTTCPVQTADFATIQQGRSMIHVDSTYFIAQALGFRADVAYWIAAYDEVTDYSQYVPIDQCGVQAANSVTIANGMTQQTATNTGQNYITAFFNGFQRTNPEHRRAARSLRRVVLAERPGHRVGWYRGVGERVFPFDRFSLSRPRHQLSLLRSKAH